MRVLAALVVILNHGVVLFSSSPPAYFSVIEYVYFGFVYADVSVFFFLSGLCLRPVNGGVGSKRISKLLIAYLLWIAIGLALAFVHHKFELRPNLSEWLQILGLHPFWDFPSYSFVLWFVRDLIIFYCLYAFFLKIGHKWRLAILVFLGVLSVVLLRYEREGHGDMLFFCNVRFVNGLFYFLAGVILAQLRSLEEWTALLRRFSRFFWVPLLLTAVYAFLLHDYNLTRLGTGTPWLRLLSMGNYVAVAALGIAFFPKASERVAKLSQYCMAWYMMHPYFFMAVVIFLPVEFYQRWAGVFLLIVAPVVWACYLLIQKVCPRAWTATLFFTNPPPVAKKRRAFAVPCEEK